jgi:hypothetical protein
MARRGQLQIVGTERTSDPEVDRVAEEFRKARNERQDQSIVEKAKKTVLLDVIEQRIKAGAIELPSDGKLHTVYSYEDEEGQTQRVRAKRGKLTVKVNVDEDDDKASDAESDEA